MITADGWLDWATRLPGPPSHTNPGVSSVRGIFMHSAEGYAGTLLDPNSPWGYNGNHSWHLTNLFDGRLFQHYPLTTRCWHATAANQHYVGCENEGDNPADLTLNDAQVANARRFSREIGEWAGWEPRRPTGPLDSAFTLWEHNEVVRLGGTASECPSGRIPWARILEDESMDGWRRAGNFWILYVGETPVMRVGSTDGSAPGRISKNFGGAWFWLRTLDDEGNWTALHFSPTEGD